MIIYHKWYRTQTYAYHTCAKVQYISVGQLEQGQALHLDRGLFEIFRNLLLAKIQKKVSNIICRSLKKKYVFQNLRTIAPKLRLLWSFHV